MELAEFEQCITDAIDMVPAHIRAKISNVAFVVDAEHRGNLLGLYHGIPLIRRNQGYSGVLPDKITIFQKTIEEVAGADPAKIRQTVISTVHHEIAHYFGFNEAEVRRWERKRSIKKRSPS